MNTLKKYLPIAVLLINFGVRASAISYEVLSPDKKIKLIIAVDNDIKWSVARNDNMLINPSPVSMTVNSIVLGKNPEIVSSGTTSGNKTIRPVVPHKFSTITDSYNQIIIGFDKDYSMIFRIYDDGVAYRFVTSMSDKINVLSEDAVFNFAGNYNIYFPEEESFYSHYEQNYKYTTLSSIKKDKFCSLPALVCAENNTKLLITEADLRDYPCMFLSGTGANSLSAIFPPVVLSTEDGDRPDRDEVFIKYAEYIAHTAGSREFPWRVVIIGENDGDLIESTMVWKLSSSCALEETDWIKPGKVAWDWWNNNNIYGVDFASGLNTNTYKYYIDFASQYKLDYINLDEGWSNTTADLMNANPDIDIKELVMYGNKKNIGIIVWALWKPLNKNLENILDIYQEWGVKGVKIDYMQRGDQDMVNFYEKAAREAARRKLFVNFHGAFKPAGLNRTYPNVLNFEGVKGMEHSRWSSDITPEHDVTIPFIRMAAGVMDFTPGAMINAQENNFRIVFTRSMSQGTRCHQIAMYVVYEAPLQMMADNPSNYFKEHECADFISRIPVTWDETKVLEAKVADYIIVARKKDAKWYMGAMTDWQPREFKIDLNFLEQGKYRIEIMQDGINADKCAIDYKYITEEVTMDSKININLAPGGGWAAIIEKAEE